MTQTFGERLRILRKRRGMTQADLARLLGVTVQTVVRYEGLRTEDLRPAKVEAIASALDVDPRDLAGWPEDAAGDEVEILARGLRNMDPGQRERLIQMMMPLIREYQTREEDPYEKPSAP